MSIPFSTARSPKKRIPATPAHRELRTRADPADIVYDPTVAQQRAISGGNASSCSSPSHAFTVIAAISASSLFFVVGALNPIYDGFQRIAESVFILLGFETWQALNMLEH